MHTKIRLILFFTLAGWLGANAYAADKLIAGPKGGRLLEANGSRAEFRVTEERKAEITFYDANLQPIAPAEQVVAVIAEPKAGRKTLEMEKTATGFVSRTPLPEADEAYRVVVQIRERADARPRNFRIDLHLELCPECELQEYACTCTEH